MISMSNAGITLLPGRVARMGRAVLTQAAPQSAMPREDIAQSLRKRLLS